MNRAPLLHRWVRWSLLWIGAVVLPAAALADEVAPGKLVVPDLTERLQALAPDDPTAYLELAEEVLAEWRSAEGRALATRLFVLAFEYDRRDSRPSSVGPSACLALASVAQDQAERRWLALMASALSPRPLTLYADDDARGPDDPSALKTRLGAAQLIALARAEHGAGARALLKDDDVRELLDQFTPELGSAQRIFERIAARPACPKCRNRRTVRSHDDSGVAIKLCPVCHGNPGARLTADEMLATLRVEAQLVDARPATWSAQVLSSAGAPVRDGDTASLAGYYAVDPSRPFWWPTLTSDDGFGSWHSRPMNAREAN